jgi:hypothetical protein
MNEILFYRLHFVLNHPLISVIAFLFVFGGFTLTAWYARNH